MLRAVLLLLLFHPAVAASQSTPARWQLTAGAGLASFSSAASRRDDPRSAEVRLAPAMRIGVALWRRLQGWEVGTGADLLTTNLQVRDGVVSVEPRGAPFTRVRAEVMAARTIARIGTAGLLAGAGPALELWTPSGGELRSRAVAGARLVLRLDAGPFALENSVAATISASPLEDEELPAGYGRRVMRTIVVAAELRFGL